MEILLGKTEVIRNLCCQYYEEILESFSKIISVKLGKKLRRNLRKTLKKYRKYFAQTFIKIFCWKLSEIFNAIFDRIYEKLYGNREKLLRNHEEINIFSNFFNVAFTSKKM